MATPYFTFVAHSVHRRQWRLRETAGPTDAVKSLAMFLKTSSTPNGLRTGDDNLFDPDDALKDWSGRHNRWLLGEGLVNLTASYPVVDLCWTDIGSK